MAEVVKRKLPLPIVQSFLTCGEIFHRQESGTTILLGPIAHVPVTHFPAHVRLSIYAEFTGGHGSYRPHLCLRNEAEEAVWSWDPPGSFPQRDPLLRRVITFNDLVLNVPGAGRYSLVLLLNDEEAARRTMWFGPLDEFRPPDPL